MSSSLAGAPAAGVDRSAPPVWFARDGANLRANLGSSMPMRPMPRSALGRLGGETGSSVGSRPHLLERFHCTGYTNEPHTRGAPLPKQTRLAGVRSEEHTSELQSLRHLVC